MGPHERPVLHREHFGVGGRQIAALQQVADTPDLRLYRQRGIEVAKFVVECLSRVEILRRRSAACRIASAAAIAPWSFDSYASTERVDTQLLCDVDFTGVVASARDLRRDE